MAHQSCKNTAGWSIPELLVASLMLSFLLLASSATLKNTLHSNRQVRTQMRSSEQLDRVASSIAQACQAAQHSPGLNSIKLNPQRLLGIPVATPSPSQPNQHTLGIVRSDPRRVYPRMTPEGERYCSIHAPSSYRASFAAIRHNELVLEPAARAKTRCLLRSGCPCESHFQGSEAHTLVELDAAYLLYVDSRHTLRRHSLHSKENQPLAYRIHSLRGRLSDNKLELTLKTLSGKTRQLRCTLSGDYHVLDAIH